MRSLGRAALAVLFVVTLGAAAADPADRLANPAEEARARVLFREVRCLVCQSQSIDESEAPLAHDLRQLIRAQIAEGRSDGQVRSFLVSRYGQFVLLSPKVSLGNAVLWIGPLVVVLAGAAALFARSRPGEAEPAELDDREEGDIAELTARKDT